MQLPEIKWDSKGNEKLDLFLSCPADEVFFGGAKGSGKTEGLLISSLGDEQTGFFSNSEWKCLVLRRTYPELERTLIRRSVDLLSKKARYDVGKRRWISPVGGWIQFGHIKTEEEMIKHQSTEWARIIIDELTHLTRRMYLYMISCLRTTDPRIKPSIRAASNPGGIGHGWVRDRFMGNKKPMKIYEDIRTLPNGRKVGWSQCFIPATVFDNRLLMKTNPSYVRTLLELPDVEREAFLYGNWDIFAGQFFTDFSDDHICDDFEIPLGWPIWISMDWGYSTKVAVGFYAEDPETRLVYLWDEIYGSHLPPSSVAGMIKEKLGKHFVDLRGRYSDRRIMLKNSNNVSTHDEFCWEGIYFEIVDLDRIEGWHRCHELLLKDFEGQVKFKVMQKCQEFIHAMPLAIHDNNKREDMDKRGEYCHLLDQFRYFCISRRGSGMGIYEPKSYNEVTGYIGIKGDDRPLRQQIKRFPGVVRGRNLFMDRIE